MSEPFIEDYVSKVALLENKIGAKTQYQILEPFPVNSRDSVAIQKAAKKIAKFVGLDSFAFIVALAHLKENVGGHVELKTGDKEVFIEISEHAIDFEAAVLATLAHEITHKYMHVHGLSYQTGLMLNYENEIFTDIASIFLGFGKLMLNGCEIERVSQETRAGGTHTTTRKLKTGYLDRKSLAFVYRLICAMRGISETEIMKNLSSDALTAFKACDKYQKKYFHPRFGTDTFRRELMEGFEEDVETLQGTLKEADRLLQFLRYDYVRSTNEFLKGKQKTVSTLRDDLAHREQNNVYDPCLRFLDGIRLEEWVRDKRAQLLKDIRATVGVQQKLRDVQDVIVSTKKTVEVAGAAASKKDSFWSRFRSR